MLTQGSLVTGVSSCSGKGSEPGLRTWALDLHLLIRVRLWGSWALLQLMSKADTRAPPPSRPGHQHRPSLGQLCTGFFWLWRTLVRSHLAFTDVGEWGGVGFMTDSSCLLGDSWGSLELVPAIFWGTQACPLP